MSSPDPPSPSPPLSSPPLQKWLRFLETEYSEAPHALPKLQSNSNSNSNPTRHALSPVEALPNRFGELGLTLSDSELQETVYEILVGACRSSGPKPLTYIPQSEKNEQSVLTSLPSSAASRVKKALGLKSSSGRRLGGGDSVSQGRSKRTGTVWEIVRVQMKVSEHTNKRVRRALLRVAVGEF